MKKFIATLLFFVLVTAGQAAVIGDFEGTSLDGWIAGWEGSPVLSNSTTPGTFTSGSQSLSVVTSGGYWCLQWNAPTVPAVLKELVFDLTMIQSEWPATPWTKPADKVAINSDGASGWKEYTSATAVWRSSGGAAPLDWGAWDPDAAKTYTVDISDYDVTGATWFQIIITLQGGNGSGAFYFDNVQLTEPATYSPWKRFEVEDADLSGTYDLGSGEGSDPAWEGFSGSGYVRLQNPAGSRGTITVNVNVREAGDYPCRFAVIAPGDEHWDNWALNVDPDTLDPGSAVGYLCRENYAASYSWAMDNDPPGNLSPAEWDAFRAAIITGSNGSPGEPWQIVPLWGPHWGDSGQTAATEMLIPMEAGSNTLSIQAGWGWATYDYIELELGYLPMHPVPADNGYAIIGLDTGLSWANALGDLDYVEVWFGETPEPNESDPNSIIGLDNYKDKLTLLQTIPSPGEVSDIPMPMLIDGVSYTWVVDGYSTGDIPGAPDVNDAFYGGPFWTFLATDNVPPTADAGSDQYQWLNGNTEVLTTLDASASSDDGKDAPLTYTWTQLAGPEATIDSPNSAVSGVTLTGGMGNMTEDGAGDPYQFELEINDGLWTRTDTVTIYVNSTSCRASIEAGGAYANADIAGPEGAGVPDCQVDLLDLAEMAAGWLTCANTFEACN